MSEATICHSFGGQTLSVNALPNQKGCLIRIYPVEGGGGMWNLDCKEVFLGRGMECDIHLDDDAASRRHAAIHTDHEGCLLVDLKSTNGTYVNNVAVKQHRLVGGDCIRVGTHVLKYLSADHIEFQYHETVFRMTTRDGLTQAFNRQYMEEFLEGEIDRVAAHKHPVTVALMDIDHFKAVNDTHGHLVGDEVLRQFSERVPAVLQGGDLFARYGGEEFAGIHSMCSEESAKELGEKIRAAVGNRPFLTHVGTLPVTVSVGLVTWDGLGDKVTVKSLLKAADDNLYAAKESGRNQVRWSKFAPPKSKHAPPEAAEPAQIR